MAIDEKWKTPLILAGIAVAAWLAYRWWRGRQATTDTGVTEGTNLNSAAPVLVGGSQGPDSGLTYSPAPPIVNVSQPVAAAPAGGDEGEGGGGLRGQPLPGHPVPSGPAPTRLSATGHKGFADFGWSGASGSARYLVHVTGANGFSKDVQVNGTHERLNLAPGTYHATVMAEPNGKPASFRVFRVT